MKKLIIQIPCFNEEETLPVTLNALPRRIQGIDKIEVLIINDGSTDRTIEVARNHGADHILNLQTHRGLSEVFLAGIFKAAKLGADYVVNFDADNQYNAGDLPKLLKPLMEGKADMVVGERPIRDNPNFSRSKIFLQRFGSSIIRKLSKTDVKDTPSGYRALNRKAMLKLHIFNDYTYTSESLINAVETGLRVTGVPISVNKEVLRPSRLIKSTLSYIFKNGANFFRYYLLYNSYPLFMALFVIFGLFGIVLVTRFFYHYFTGHGQGLIQSLVIAAISFTISLISLMMGVISDMLRINRKMLQKISFELREFTFKKDTKPGAQNRGEHEEGKADSS